jgi:hypothetical protein
VEKEKVTGWLRSREGEQNAARLSKANTARPPMGITPQHDVPSPCYYPEGKTILRARRGGSGQRYRGAPPPPEHPCVLTSSFKAGAKPESTQNSKYSLERSQTLGHQGTPTQQKLATCQPTELYTFHDATADSIHALHTSAWWHQT